MLKLAREIGLKLFPQVPNDTKQPYLYKEFIVWNIVKGLLEIQIQNHGDSTEEQDNISLLCRDNILLCTISKVLDLNFKKVCSCVQMIYHQI